jgi:pimeloyl-ACP methyl ester carboxylesterase
VAAVARVVEASADDVVLVAHSGGGIVIAAVVDHMPENVAVAVYADSGPLPNGVAVNKDVPPDAVEVPLPSWAEFEAVGTSLEGLDDEKRARFASGAIPHPAGPVRESLELTNTARFEVPIVLITSSFSAEQVRELAAQGMPFFAEIPKFEHCTIVELPTGHWPLFSRPDDLAVELEKVAASI